MSFQETAESPRRAANENCATPDQAPRFGRVPIREPGGWLLGAYCGPLTSASWPEASRCRASPR